MPDGLVIERLPVGIARGIWRVIFVAWGGGSSLRGPSARPDADIRERVTVSGVGADLQACGSLAGASDSRAGSRLALLGQRPDSSADGVHVQGRNCRPRTHRSRPVTGPGQRILMPRSGNTHDRSAVQKGGVSPTLRPWQMMKDSRRRNCGASPGSLGPQQSSPGVFLIARFNTPHTWDSGTAFALGVGVMASVFSASCAVIAAVKEAEVRIRRNDPGRSTTRPSSTASSAHCAKVCLSAV